MVMKSITFKCLLPLDTLIKAEIKALVFLKFSF